MAKRFLGFFNPGWFGTFFKLPRLSRLPKWANGTSSCGHQMTQKAWHERTGCHAFPVIGLTSETFVFLKKQIDPFPNKFPITLHCVHQIIMSSGGRLGNPSTKPNCKTHRNIVRISEKIIFWFSLITCYYIRIILGLCCPFKSRKSLEKRPQNMVIFEGDWTLMFWKMFQITEV